VSGKSDGFDIFFRFYWILFVYVNFFLYFCRLFMWARVRCAQNIIVESGNHFRIIDKI
jgi:hypothetical protein